MSTHIYIGKYVDFTLYSGPKREPMIQVTDLVGEGHFYVQFPLQELLALIDEMERRGMIGREKVRTPGV